MQGMLRCALVAAVLLACVGTASADELRVLGATLQLPFAYQRVHATQRSSHYAAMRTSESLEIAILDGPAQGQHLYVVADYWSDEDVDMGKLRTALRTQADEDRKRPGVREIAQVRIGGYDFWYMDGRVKNTNAQWPENMGATGEVGGGLLSVDFFAKDAAPLTPALAEALKSLAIDFDPLMRAKSRFGQEAEQMVQGTVIDTPLGRIELGKGAIARMVSSGVQYDGNGAAIGRERGFVARREGFWRPSFPTGLNFGCMSDDDARYKRLMSLYDDDDSVSIKERTIATGAPAPVPFLGGTGVLVRGKGPENYSRATILRTALRKDGTVYYATITRDGGTNIESDVNEWLETAAPQCRMDPVVAPAPGAPPAPKPAAGDDAAPRVSTR
ncbi:hypothetical protein LF41_1371 [Lysobacter dokdonensis DS-58]|uniref:Uncharacterized protein n=1 Tax=Lysobacter dokdonensis DS-58 TaxID=1300345 RepID=A0A0A2WI37_9GAMM|nr:hypothetical protein [Lysobacter dokdonensis]KGQ18372.1 hypothetical protein LF41_1371 [Lysobacter dokdonensis DS-58]